MTIQIDDISKLKIVVVGLGYVGLPLTVELSKIYKVLGFDVDPSRINELEACFDRTGEVCGDDIEQLSKIVYSSDADSIEGYDLYIITVPTPIDRHKSPDLGPIEDATRLVASKIKKGAIIVYESTVYPCLTEEFCIPLIEEISGLKVGVEFSVGYSPERINPGDKKHTLKKIKKVVAGYDEFTANLLDAIYSSIIPAGTYVAESIKVAEAAKVIENTQRDINIAFVNELTSIFSALGINTQEVLAAARTKWNFLPFTPGLVGGHCIGVDPYYLTHKAMELGLNPELILAGRRINDNMPKEVVQKTIKELLKAKKDVTRCKFLIMGFTFKENCPDFRNTGVFKVFKELSELNLFVDIVDPWLSSSINIEGEELSIIDTPRKSAYDAILICVNHDAFKELGFEFVERAAAKNAVVFDLKNTFPEQSNILRL